jgi:hypothetical protein
VIVDGKLVYKRGRKSRWRRHRALRLGPSGRSDLVADLVNQLPRRPTTRRRGSTAGISAGHRLASRPCDSDDDTAEATSMTPSSRLRQQACSASLTRVVPRSWVASAGVVCDYRRVILCRSITRFGLELRLLALARSGEPGSIAAWSSLSST